MTAEQTLTYHGCDTGPRELVISSTPEPIAQGLCPEFPVFGVPLHVCLLGSSIPYKLVSGDTLASTRAWSSIVVEPVL